MIYRRDAGATKTGAGRLLATIDTSRGQRTFMLRCDCEVMDVYLSSLTTSLSPLQLLNRPCPRSALGRKLSPGARYHDTAQPRIGIPSPQLSQDAQDNRWSWLRSDSNAGPRYSGSTARHTGQCLGAFSGLIKIFANSFPHSRHLYFGMGMVSLLISLSGRAFFSVPFGRA